MQADGRAGARAQRRERGKHGYSFQGPDQEVAYQPLRVRDLTFIQKRNEWESSEKLTHWWSGVGVENAISFAL